MIQPGLLPVVILVLITPLALGEEVLAVEPAVAGSQGDILD